MTASHVYMGAGRGGAKRSRAHPKLGLRGTPIAEVISEVGAGGAPACCCLGRHWDSSRGMGPSCWRRWTGVPASLTEEPDGTAIGVGVELGVYRVGRMRGYDWIHEVSRALR